MGQKNKQGESDPIRLRMRELREMHGRTQQEVADALGITQHSYSRMESSGLRYRRRDLVTLAVLYGMPFEKAFPGFTPRAAA